MNHYQDLVQQFHQAMEMPVGNYADPKISRPDLRIDLILEEAQETWEAIYDRNMVEVVDGLCDVIYVAYGAAVELGVVLCEFCEPFVLYSTPPVFRDPDLYAQMLREASVLACRCIGVGDVYLATKALSRLVTVCYDTAAMFSLDLHPLFLEVHRSNMAKVGGPVRADGKKLKPPGWTPPKIKELLEAQGYHD